MNKVIYHMMGVFCLLVIVLSVLGVQAAPLIQEVEPTAQGGGNFTETASSMQHYDGLEEQPHLSTKTRPPDTQASPEVGYVSLDQIVFQSYRNNNWEIYVGFSNGPAQYRLTWDGSADIHPRFNRGCTRIAFASKRTGNYEIFTMNADGSGLIQLTSNGADDVYPSWSPDGTKILFQTYRDGQSEVYVMNADGTAQTRLTWDADYDGEPVWSPDGSKIAFTSRRTGGYRVYMMNPDSSGLVQLSNQPYSENPTWSPDGLQIAYDADNNGDGWQELWLMNSDGSNQRLVYKPSQPQTDAWARSWSPYGGAIAFTEISFIYDQGNLYWTYAYLKYWNSYGYNGTLTPGDTEWNPDWQTSDNQPPTSSMLPLPGQSPAPIVIRWSSYDNGAAGLKSCDVQVKDGAGGTWTDWLTGMVGNSALYPGIGGHTYYFRVRARDMVWNVEAWPPDYDVSTAVENYPPQSAVYPLPAYSRNGTIIRWGGHDVGGSGIQNYDVQYRDKSNGDWTDWLSATRDERASFNGIPGHAYYFRARATDFAGNVESWTTGGGDATTTLYTWGISGEVLDQANIPVANALITTTPAASLVFPSDIQGRYGAYGMDSVSTYNVIWQKDGYGSLPVTTYRSEQDPKVEAILPPDDDLMQNGGFETGVFAPSWTVGGNYTPIITDTQHTGQFAASLGESQTRWDDIVRISHTSGGSYYPKAGVDSYGNIHLVWLDTTGSYQLWYAIRIPGSSWSTPVKITNSSPQIMSFDGMVVEPDGVVNIIYSTIQQELMYIRRDSSGVWSSPYSISGICENGPGARFAVDKRGIVYVAWKKRPSGEGTNIFFTQREVDGTWSTPIVLYSDPNYAYVSDMLADTFGNLHVILVAGIEWGPEWNPEVNVYYTQRSAGDTWIPPQDISGMYTGGGINGCGRKRGSSGYLVEHISRKRIVLHTAKFSWLLVITRKNTIHRRNRYARYYLGLVIHGLSGASPCVLVSKKRCT